MQVVFDPIIMLSNAAAAFGLNMSVFLLIGKVRTFMIATLIEVLRLLWWRGMYVACARGLFLPQVAGCRIWLLLLHHHMHACDFFLTLRCARRRRR